MKLTGITQSRAAAIKGTHTLRARAFRLRLNGGRKVAWVSRHVTVRFSWSGFSAKVAFSRFYSAHPDTNCVLNLFLFVPTTPGNLTAYSISACLGTANNRSLSRTDAMVPCCKGAGPELRMCGVQSAAVLVYAGERLVFVLRFLRGNVSSVQCQVYKQRHPQHHAAYVRCVLEKRCSPWSALC